MVAHRPHWTWRIFHEFGAWPQAVSQAVGPMSPGETLRRCTGKKPGRFSFSARAICKASWVATQNCSVGISWYDPGSYPRITQKPWWCAWGSQDTFCNVVFTETLVLNITQYPQSRFGVVIVLEKALQMGWWSQMTTVAWINHQAFDQHWPAIDGDVSEFKQRYIAISATTWCLHPRLGVLIFSLEGIILIYLMFGKRPWGAALVSS